MNDNDLTYNRNANPCKKCEGGLVFFVMGGDTPAHAKPVSNRAQPEAFGYCVVSTAPCSACDAGIRVATARRKMSAKEGAIVAAPNLKTEKFKYFCEDFVRHDSIIAHDFARLCNHMRHKQNLAQGRTESGLHDAKTGKPIIDSAPISNAVDEAFAAMKRQFGLA